MGLAVDADVVAGVEVAAAICDAALSNHLRHIAAHFEQAKTVRMM